MTKIVEKFNGKPITKLNWWELVKYNVALSQANVASGTNVTGNINETIFAQFGITFVIEQDGDK